MIILERAGSNAPRRICQGTCDNDCTFSLDIIRSPVGIRIIHALLIVAPFFFGCTYHAINVTVPDTRYFFGLHVIRDGVPHLVWNIIVPLLDFREIS